MTTILNEIFTNLNFFLLINKLLKLIINRNFFHFLKQCTLLLYLHPFSLTMQALFIILTLLPTNRDPLIKNKNKRPNDESLRFQKL